MLRFSSLYIHLVGVEHAFIIHWLIHNHNINNDVDGGDNEHGDTKYEKRETYLRVLLFSTGLKSEFLFPFLSSSSFFYFYSIRFILFLT